MALAPRKLLEELDPITINWPGGSVDLRDYVVDASIQMSVQDISMVQITLDDPGWQIASHNKLVPEYDDTTHKPNGDYTIVNFGDQGYAIIGIELSAGPGNIGGIVLSLQPQSIVKLKDTYDPVDSNPAVGGSVAAYAQAVGIEVVVDPQTPATDGDAAAQQYDNLDSTGDNLDTSAWAAMQGEAGSNQWLMFEVDNKIWYGKESFIADQRGTYTYDFSKRLDDDSDIVGYPNLGIHQGDDNIAMVSFSIRIEAAARIGLGQRLNLLGLPEPFTGNNFIITGINYSLTDVAGNVDVTAKTIKDPKNPEFVNPAGTPIDGEAPLPDTGGADIPPGNGVEGMVTAMLALVNDESHGYSHSARNGPDYDCSSSIYYACKAAGIPVPSTAWATSTMKPFMESHGWQVVGTNVRSSAGLMRGDVILNPGKHVEVYIGDNKRAGFKINELGGIRGGRPGDQTGQESRISPFNGSWRYVLRYTG